MIDGNIQFIYMYLLQNKHDIYVVCEKEKDYYVIDIIYKDDYFKRQYITFTLSPQKY